MNDVIESKYGQLIRDFREHFGQRAAVIAGGAIRDTLLGREVKDIDIVVQEPLSEAEAENYLGQPFRRIRISRAEYDDGQLDGGSTLLYALESADKAINVLVVMDVQQKIRSFPDTISMVYFDGTNVVQLPQFTEAVRTKTIKYAPRTTTERLARLTAKYEGEYQFQVTEQEIL